MQLRSLADDAAAIANRDAAVAFCKNPRQRPGTGRGQPQAQQVPLTLGLGPVLVGERACRIVWLCRNCCANHTSSAALGHEMVTPLSTGSTWPVTMRDSSLAR